MAKKFLGALFARDDDDDGGQGGDGGGEGGDGGDERGDGEEPEPGARPRSLSDAWLRLAEQNKRVEQRLAALEATQQRLLETAQALADTAKQQHQVLLYIGKFHESAEKRGREMESAFRGVPDVLRTLPSATREQAERLSEIAARLYEKAQDNTVNALKSAQANHQRAIEDLIDKSLGASRRAVYSAIVMAAVAVVAAIYVFSRS
jgi:hypothetical protein